MHDQTVSDGACAARRRLAAADGDQTDVIADLSQCFLDDMVKRGLGGNFLEVVEDQNTFRRQTGEEFPEKAPRKSCEVGQIFGGEERQGLAFARSGPLQGLAEIVEKSGRIGIAAVHLIPDPRDLAVLEIRCDQRRLARTRWSGNPNDGPLAAVVQPLEQSLAWRHAVELRTAYFRQGRRGLWHSRGLE